MKKYECLYIVNMSVDSEGTSAVSARVEGLLKNVGAELKNTQPWGKRKLAYAIDKERYGDYVLVHFQGEDPDLAEFHRELEIERAILHYMTIRLDEFPDFDSLTVPQAIDTDRKRMGGRGDRRPRYEDRNAAPAAEEKPAVEAKEESPADAEAPADAEEATETVKEAVEAPAEETEATEATEEAPAEEAVEVEDVDAEPVEAPETTETEKDADAEPAEAPEAAEESEEKPADSE